MQALANTQRLSAAKPSARAIAPRGALRVVCKANSKQVEAAKATIASLPIMLAANPAFALVDERMNGDGTGLPFGVNEGGVGWAIVITLTVMWSIWVTSQKDLGSDEGLDLDS